MKGRPPKWADKIDCPPEAKEFYELIQKLQTSTAFRDCHVFSGASINHVPHISWDNTVTALPKVILGFLGIPYRRQICKTHGCANPFHYVDAGLGKVTLKGLKGPIPEPHRPDSNEALIELVEYHIDKAGFEPDEATFENVRPLIPQEDITDELLKLSLVYLKQRK